MAFRKKADFILTYKPDILIVPECEHPDKLKFGDGTLLPTDICWFGSNKNKGLGVFSYSEYRLKLHKNHNADLKIILPISVSKEDRNFILFAIWANNPKDPDCDYVTQVWKAINYYKNLIKEVDTILIGDFNSNTIWDKPRREGNHSTVVKILKEKNIHSAYHKYFKQNQGDERHPTLFMYRNQKKPYHIDYCFTSADFADKILDVQVGSFKEWRSHSDHAPLIVTFKD